MLTNRRYPFPVTKQAQISFFFSSGTFTLAFLVYTYIIRCISPTHADCMQIKKQTKSIQSLYAEEQFALDIFDSAIRGFCFRCFARLSFDVYFFSCQFPCAAIECISLFRLTLCSPIVSADPLR